MLSVAKRRNDEGSIPLVDNRRHIALADGSDVWLFVVDELYGIYTCETKRIKQSGNDLLKGVIEWGPRTSVGLIDEDRLYSHIKRALQ